MDATQPMNTDRSRKGIARFAFVERLVNVLTQKFVLYQV
jgi:hypothetical protein